MVCNLHAGVEPARLLEDWKYLTPAPTAQFLDQPGRAEKPGDLQR